MNFPLFKDRKEAGKLLALRLQEYREKKNAIVIALPRGGVVVGYEVAKALHLPLDIISPRKIGAPSNPELAIGAITETGEGIFSQRLIEELDISEDVIKKAVEKEKKEAARRLSHYRKNRPPRDLKGKIVLLIDDGVSTGSTLFAAIKTIRAEEAGKIILGIPVAPPETFAKLQKDVEQAICLSTPTPFFAVGQFYEIFDQTSDEEVISLLKDHSN